MKKLITLTFALLFSAGMAFGQNTATTTQYGTNNEATVQQHSSGNKAIVNQGVPQGNAHDNFVHLDQTYISGNGVTDINEITITQTGHGQDVGFEYHYNNDGEITGYDTQVGAGNKLTVTQNKHDNHVYRVHQGTADQISTNGIMDITQGGNKGYGSYNFVAHAVQKGNANKLTVFQEEEDKIWIQAQVSTGQTGNSVNINQYGKESIIGHSAVQWNRPRHNGYGVYQHGTNNRMDIDQGTHAYAGSKRVNDVFSNYSGLHGDQSLVQLGSDNVLTIKQNGAGTTVGAVMQNGVGNMGTINQGMGANTANLMQWGDGNTATISQGTLVQP